MPAKAATALEISPPDAPKPRKRGGKPVAVEEHTVVKKWAEEVKIEKPKPARPIKRTEPDIDESEEDELDEIYADLPEDVGAFLQTNNGQKEVTMEVREIPGPRTDVFPGIRAGIYRANHRFDVDTFQDDLALYYAPPNKEARYMLRLKCGGQYVVNGTIFPVDVVGASVERKIAANVIVEQPAPVVAVNQSPVPQITVHQPADEDQVIDRFFTRMERWDKMTRRFESKPDVPVQNPAQMTEEDILIRAALSSEEAQRKVSSGLLGKLFGAAAHADDRNPAWDLAEKALDLLAPGINALLTVGAQKMAQAQVAVAQQQTPPPSLPEAAQAEIPPPVQPEPPRQPEPEEVIFGLILGDCVKRKIVKAEVCAVNVLRFVDQYRNEAGWSPFDNAIEIFLSADAADIVAYAATQNPIAARLANEEDVMPWLRAVQEEIRKEWAQDVSGEENS